MRLETYLSTRHEAAAAFGHRLGVAQSTVLRWIDGSEMPTRDDLRLIWEVTGGEVQPNDFVLDLVQPLPAADADLSFPSDEEEAEAEARALEAAIAEADADPRSVPHSEVRKWLLRIAAGDFDAPPPVPR